MALDHLDPTKTKAWDKLQQHFLETKDKKIKDLFASNPNRATKLSLEWDDFFVDFSKNRITEDTISHLIGLAEEVGLKSAISKYFEGDRINQTENRSVLHTALRASNSEVVNRNGQNFNQEVNDVKEKIRNFSNSVIKGNYKGYTAKEFTDIVNIGIGGSDLGPVMVTEALQFYKNELKVHFVSNVDGDHVHATLKELDPETTLFIIVSKSFTTQETLTNANTIKTWFLKSADSHAIAKHFVAVSTNLKKITEFGIEKENIFPMWDWVGGRFSLWSAVGLSIALAIGPNNFEDLLEGAQGMDSHFRSAPFVENLPVILALLSIWYNNFYEAETEVVIPYTHYLHRFPAYLQQAVMESNGKSVDRSGNRVDYETGNIIWGEPGTNSQHAFFQLIHQGTKLIPADFIGFKKSLHADDDHHKILMANFFAQTQALMTGKSAEDVHQELTDQGYIEEELKNILPFKIFEGNKPTTTILIEALTPRNLGALIALYEHKIFVQGVLWNIYSYDQWGVELGKQLATNILSVMNGSSDSNLDSSTKNLLQRYNQ